MYWIFASVTFMIQFYFILIYSLFFMFFIGWIEVQVSQTSFHYGAIVYFMEILEFGSFEFLSWLYHI